MIDDLRSEIRAAFDREQALHPPAASLRRNVVGAVTTQTRREPNLQWVAVVAALILGVLVVAGLMSTRLAHRSPAPAAAPRADYGPPPAGVNLLYVHDPNHPTWLIGYDWQGNPRATVKLDPSMTALQMAPDGQSFAVGYTPKGGTGEILDRFGQPVPGSGAIPSVGVCCAPPGQDWGAYGYPTLWADDNVHICSVSYVAQKSEWDLITVAPGEAVKSVASAIDPQGRIVRSGIIGVRVAGCSIRNNEAIITRGEDSSVMDVWAVRISDGAILAHHSYPDPELLAYVTVSRDATLFAENSGQSNGNGGATAPHTVIRRVSDWSVVATLDPKVGVLAFSSDDSLMLVFSGAGQPSALAVTDLRSGRTLWRYDGRQEIRDYMAQPGGRDFAIYLVEPGIIDRLATFIIIHADGTTTDFPHRYAPAW